MKSRAPTERSKCKYYTKNGRKNVTSERSTTNANYGRRQTFNYSVYVGEKVDEWVNEVTKLADFTI